MLSTPIPNQRWALRLEKLDAVRCALSLIGLSWPHQKRHVSRRLHDGCIITSSCMGRCSAQQEANRHLHTRNYVARQLIDSATLLVKKEAFMAHRTRTFRWEEPGNEKDNVIREAFVLRRYRTLIGSSKDARTSRLSSSSFKLVRSSDSH